MFWSGHYTHYCHWCNKPYESKKPKEQARFCSATCKQAHYRAYKKYVTTKRYQSTRAPGPKVTRKKLRKRGKESGKKSRK